MYPGTTPPLGPRLAVPLALRARLHCGAWSSTRAGARDLSNHPSKGHVAVSRGPGAVSQGLPFYVIRGSLYGRADGHVLVCYASSVLPCSWVLCSPPTGPTLRYATYGRQAAYGPALHSHIGCPLRDPAARSPSVALLFAHCVGAHRSGSSTGAMRSTPIRPGVPLTDPPPCLAYGWRWTGPPYGPTLLSPNRLVGAPSLLVASLLLSHVSLIPTSSIGIE